MRSEGSDDGYRPSYRSNSTTSAEEETCLDPFSGLVATQCLEPGTKHLLPFTWSFWCLKPPQGSKSNASNYESFLKRLGSFRTVEDFWAIYLRLKRPEEVIRTGTADYSIFKEAIRPVWEDAHNAEGGKLTLRLKKGGLVSLRFWELLALNLLGGGFDQYMDEINGIMFSVRHYEDIVSIWTRDANDAATIGWIREEIRNKCNLSPLVCLEYKPHHFVKGYQKRDDDQ